MYCKYEELNDELKVLIRKKNGLTRHAHAIEFYCLFVYTFRNACRLRF